MYESGTRIACQRSFKDDVTAHDTRTDELTHTGSWSFSLSLDATHTRRARACAFPFTQALVSERRRKRRRSRRRRRRRRRRRSRRRSRFCCVSAALLIAANYRICITGRDSVSPRHPRSLPAAAAAPGPSKSTHRGRRLRARGALS
jgi:hypothetical protein